MYVNNICRCHMGRQLLVYTRPAEQCGRALEAAKYERSSSLSDLGPSCSDLFPISVRARRQDCHMVAGFRKCDGRSCYNYRRTPTTRVHVINYE